MADFDFDFEGARKAGLSDKKIAEFLAPEIGYDLEGARKAGLSDEKIVGFFHDHLTASDTGRGFRTALGQTVPLMKGAVGLIGATAEKAVGEGGMATAVKDWGLKGYQEGMEKLQPLAREGDDVSVAWDRAKDGDLGALVDWAQYASGYVGGQIAETIGVAAAGAIVGGAMGGPAGAGAGGVAGAAAKTTAKGVLSSLVEKQVAKRVAAGMTEQAATKAVARDIGAGVALGGYNLGQEAGSIYGEGAELAQRKGVDVDGGDLARMWAASIAAAATETGTDILGLKLGTGKIALPGGRAGRAAKGLIGGVVVEGAQEGVQTGLERYGAAKDLSDPDAVRDYINSIALGAFGGGAVGGIGGALSKEQQAGVAPPGAQPPPSATPPAPPTGLLPPSVIPMGEGAIDPMVDIERQRTIDAAQKHADEVYGARDAYEASKPDPITQILDASSVDEAIAAAENAISNMPALAGVPAVDDSVTAEFVEKTPMQLAVERARSRPIPGVLADQRGALPQPSSAAPEAVAPPALLQPEIEPDRGVGPEADAAPVPDGPVTAAEVAAVQDIPTTDKMAMAVEAIGEEEFSRRVEKDIAKYRPTTEDQKAAHVEAVAIRAIVNAQRSKNAEASPALPVTESQVPDTAQALETGDPGVATGQGGGAPQQILGHSWEEIKQAQQRGSLSRRINTRRQGDYGADPIGDGTFRMVPSGDIVNLDERNRRLQGPGTQAGEAGSVSATSATIADAAHEAATSPLNDLPEPTEAQKEAGNYRKGHYRVSGLDISIENPAGSRRRAEWPELAQHYGYIRGTVGKDKDHIDVFIPDNIDRDYAGPVAVVNQQNKEGGFDEHKVVFGAQDEAQARAMYLENYTPGWNGIQSIAMFPDMGSFKQWIAEGDHTKPARSPEDALQVGSTETVDVGQRPEDGGALAEGNAAKEEVAEAGQAPEGVDRQVERDARIREIVGLDKTALEAYDPEKAVFKVGEKWYFKTTDGNDHPGASDTRREAVEFASRHKAIKLDQYDNPSGYFDLASLLARQRLELIKKYESEGMSEMDAGKRAATEIPDFKPTTGETNEAVPSQKGPEAPTDAGQEKALLSPRVTARAEDLRSMAQEAGWAEVGGRIIRDPTTNQVTGRTKWIPKAEWWPGRPDGISDRDFREAVRKAAAGEKLKPREQRAVDYALQYLDELDARNELAVEEQEIAAKIEEIAEGVLSKKHSPEQWAALSEAEKEAELDEIFGSSQPKEQENEPAIESKAQEAEAGAEKRGDESGTERGQAEDERAQRAEESAAVKKHGLPESTVFEPGKYGPLTKGKVRAIAEGQESNWHDTQDAAAAELADFLSIRREGKEAQAKRDAAEVVLADKIKAGEKPSFDEWRAAFPQLKPGHTYLRQPDISPFLVKHFGFSKARIREPLGRAAGTVTSDGGAQYPIVYFNRLAEVLGTPVLEQYTEQELAAREAEQAKKDAAEKAAQDKAEAKRKADAEVGEFDLTGSDRKADANPNQGDLLQQAQTEKSSRQANVDNALWMSETNAVGGVPTILLTQEGRERAFRVGTGKAVEGPLLDALETLYGGPQKVDSPGMSDVPLMHPWVKRDGEWLSLSAEGRDSVKRGFEEQARLLDRVKRGITLEEGGSARTPQAKSLKDITVTVPAIDSDGRSMKIKQDAETALRNVDSQLEKARGLLQCLLT